MEPQLTTIFNEFRSGQRFRAKFLKANGDERIILGTIPKEFKGVDHNGNVLCIEEVSGNYRMIKLSRILRMEAI